MEGWGNGCGELEDLLGGLEDQGWCLACGVYGHTVAICPFQDEEEKQERKAGRRSRKRKGRGKLQQQQQPLQQQEDDNGWEVYIVNLVAEFCPGCGAYGHTLAICPTQYKDGEPKHPVPRGGSLCIQRPEGGSPCIQHPEGGSQCIQCPEGGSPCIQRPEGGSPCIQHPGLQQQRKNSCCLCLHHQEQSSKSCLCLRHLHRQEQSSRSCLCLRHLHQQRVNACSASAAVGGQLTAPSSTSRG
ncbi:UNVERIFIED_CONTAM: hypothetical protein FKN15_055522 [Acipenser sinensis]